MHWHTYVCATHQKNRDSDLGFKDLMVTSHFSYFNLVMCSHSSETPPFVDMLTMTIIIMTTLCNPNNYTIFIVINAQKVLLQTLCLIVIV